MIDTAAAAQTGVIIIIIIIIIFIFGETLLSFVHLHSVTVKPSSRKLCSQYINWDSFTKH